MHRLPLLRAAIREALEAGQATVRGAGVVRGKWSEDRERQRSKVALNFVG